MVTPHYHSFLADDTKCVHGFIQHANSVTFHIWKVALQKPFLYVHTLWKIVQRRIFRRSAYCIMEEYAELLAALGPPLPFDYSSLTCMINATDTMRRNNRIRNTPQMDYGRAMEAVVDLATLCDTTWHRHKTVMKSWCVGIRDPPIMFHTRTSHWLDETESPWTSWDPRMALYSESTTPRFDSCVFFGRKPRPVVLWRDPRRLIEMVRHIAMNWCFRLYSIFMMERYTRGTDKNESM